MSFANLKIGTRLGLGFTLVLALLAAVAGLGMASMARIDARMEQIVDNHNVKIFAASKMGEQFRDLTLAVSNIVFMQEAAALKEQTDKMGKGLHRGHENAARHRAQ